MVVAGSNRRMSRAWGGRIVGVVQARLASTRLPGKVLLPIQGRPVLQWMLERVRAAEELDEVVVATTDLPSDDPIRALCVEMGIPCLSGHPTDLLDRHLQVARALDADAVVKIPSDCPLVDPRVIDAVVGCFRFHHPRYSFVSNLHPASWPDGNDVEVIRVDALVQAWREAVRPFEREHTTPFIWDRPERFSICNVRSSGGRDLSSSHRLTLDYQEDFRLIVAVFEALHRPGLPPFSAEEIVDYLDTRPDLRSLNARRLGTSWISRHLDELRTMRRAAPAGSSTSSGSAGRTTTQTTR